MAIHSGIFFDKRDEIILKLVNRILDSNSVFNDSDLDPHLHPHGIKELVDTPAARMAYAVASLLRNLEFGGVQARDRLLGLQVLYDEVMSSAHSTLRRNTARVLMQIMKSIVRAHGDEYRQMKLVHDFRAAAQGTPRIVRRLLKRYHLPEMDESWNQLAFDDHVYDMNTRGRKSPTHLIMDAWIKGLRTLTIVYDNCVTVEAAREVLSAASIVGISVRVGLEFRAPFRGRFINILWVPRGFSSNSAFLEFLRSDKMTALSERGREIVSWERERVLDTLAVWNDSVRPQYVRRYGIVIPPLSADDFLNFVGRGHASRPRLAECLFRLVKPVIAKKLAEMPKGQDGTAEEIALRAELERVSSDIIQEEWLNAEVHPQIPSVDLSRDIEQLPGLLQLPPYELMQELARVNAGYRMILCTTGLSVQDVMELLWDSHGFITHLEIFSMRGWIDGRMPDINEIGELQHALNAGQGPRLKQMVRQMIRDMQNAGDEERAVKFEDILHAIPTVWEHYRHSPLKSRIGTGSSSRSRTFGMGLVVTETLPRRGAKMLEKRHSSPMIPIWAPVEEHVIYREPELPERRDFFLKSLRWLPGCAHLGCTQTREWESPRDNLSVSSHGNIANLGGLSSTSGAPLEEEDREKGSPGIHYLNNTLTNVLKCLVGFIPAFLSFIYTQDLWFLAWFGAIIWFGITGVRNVMQMVLSAKGVSRNTLLHWKDKVSVSRICDSLMYSGISVFLLEVVIRVWMLEKGMGITVTTDPVYVFTVCNFVNGLYICAHNIYRGFPRSAAIGNIFRSVLAIPMATAYNAGLGWILVSLGVQHPEVIMVSGAAVVSKLASDTVAALIEGLADSHLNVQMRAIDYRNKVQSVFDCYTRLEMLFPKEDALIRLARPGGLNGRGGSEAKRLERALIVNALDLMYIWYCQPRAQDAFRRMVSTMTVADRSVLAVSQLVLMREREVSQLMVDGLVGRSFARPLAFFLDHRRSYMKDIVCICRPGRYAGLGAPHAVFSREQH